MSIKGAAVFGILMLPILGPGSAEAQPSYSLVLSSHPSRELAQERMAAVSELFEHAAVEENAAAEGAAFQVQAGRFATYADAWAVKSALPAELSQGAWIAKAEAPAGAAASAASAARQKTPVKMPFDLANLDARDAGALNGAFAACEAVAARQRVRLDEKLLSMAPGQMDADQLLVAGIDAKSNGAGIPALQEYLKRFGSAPEANKARIRLSRRLMGRKEYEQAEKLLHQVEQSGKAEEQAAGRLLKAYLAHYSKSSREAYEAFCTVANDARQNGAVRLDAMRRAASCAHQAGDYSSAWLAFRQIEQASPDAAARAEACVQLAGLAFELAGRAKGSYEEVQRFCSEVAELPGIARAQKATAELMRLEARFYAGDVAGALEEAEAFLRAYPDVKREFTSASVWKGVFLCKLNRLAEAEPALEAVAKSQLASSDKFGGHEPQAKAAYWLVWLGVQKNDPAMAERYLELLRTQFPKTREAQQAQSLAAAPAPSATQP